MNKISTILLYILTPFTLFANEIEILSDIPGNGTEIKIHYKLDVDYIGSFEDGTVFDSSFNNNESFKFQIGLRQVIPGWEIGLMGMKSGGKRIIKIPSTLDYGEKGIPGVIPPNSTLIFEIEILNVQPPGYKQINVENLITLSKKDLKIIDIRTLKRWEETGIIKGSHQISAFDTLGNFNSNFIKRFNSVVMKDENVVFVSDKGEISSILANGFVEHLGVKNVYSLKGGIQEWILKNNEVIKKKEIRHHLL